ncbi:MAG TPA: GntR family transcriptional regulator [Tepidisphaeraceae bacterium]|jgi:GntR family transcriptional regulator|nr:GntR family transcriptional regulator [Tepidisphaeraceae bacterium]
MPLEISIATGSTVPIYRQIGDQVCRAVATGKLAAGEQMPSVRALAEQLVINPNTVAKTYADLIREGILEAQQGKGVFVARRRAVYTKAERLRRIDASLEAFVNDGVYLGFSAEELHEALERKLRRLATFSEKGESSP